MKNITYKNCNGIERQREVCLNFGKYRGKSVGEIGRIEWEYMDWVLGKDFSVEVKEKIEYELELYKIKGNMC